MQNEKPERFHLCPCVAFIYSSSLIVDSECVFGVEMKIMKKNFPEDTGGVRVCVCLTVVK